VARSCGIRIGQTGFELVVLDGSPKKPKLVLHKLGRFPADSEDLEADMVAAIRAELKGLKLPDDNVGLAVDTGLAAFRTVKLPFADREKIEEVIKFEVENQLPQWEIDDVIVDFLRLSSSSVETKLLVTAVPKDKLGMRLTVCESVGLEPLEAELEATAVVNAAQQAGVLGEESAQVLVHVGESSTSVIVVDGGALRSVRAIHAGALLTSSGVPIGGEPVEEGAHAPSLPEIAARIRRELGRTVSGAQTVHPIECIYACGFGVDELLGDSVVDLPVRRLEVIDPEQVPDPAERDQLAVAFGVALRQLGGGIVTPRLRREELRHLGKFERLELPLAVLGLLIVTLLSVKLIIIKEDIKTRESDMTRWLKSSNLNMLGNPKQAKAGWLAQPPERLAGYAANAEAGEVAQERRYHQLQQIETMLVSEIEPLQQKLGVGDSGEIPQPLSAFQSLVLVLGVLDELGGQVGIFAIRQADASYLSGRGRSEDRVEVKLDLSFFDEDTVVASQRWNRFYETLSGMPWFVEGEKAASSVMENQGGIFIDNFKVIVDPSKAEEELS